MSTITREWLKQTISDMEEHRDLFPGDLDDDHASVLSAFRIALASLEAEPVVYMWDSERKDIDAPGYYRPEHLVFAENSVKQWGGRIVPLYTAPPATVAAEINRRAIADKVYVKCCRIPGATFYNAAEFALDEVEACRSVMLHGADGNSPVIPDGWVACSERMPNIGVPVITAAGDVVQYAAYAWDGKEWQDWYEEYDKLPANTFTHWHPRPAAPQQEVK